MDKYYIQNRIRVIKSSDNFNKSIPFKIYVLEGENSGTPEHTHDYIQIWYVVSGRCEHKVEDISNHFVKGNIFVLPPFITHKIKTIPGESVKIIGCEFQSSFINENIPYDGRKGSLFDFAYLEPFLVSAEAVKPRLILEGTAQLKVEQLLKDMLYEYNNEEKYYEINIKADLLKLLAILAREYEKHFDVEYEELFNRYREAVNSALDYINNNFTEELYVEDICKMALMSQSYFSYFFKQITGKTFVEYINSLRIHKAVELLINSDMSVTDICYSTGFNNCTYFSRIFKKETGLSPSRFRSLSSES